jgi:hypothetical protein
MPHRRFGPTPGHTGARWVLYRCQPGTVQDPSGFSPVSGLVGRFPDRPRPSQSRPYPDLDRLLLLISDFWSF